MTYGYIYKIQFPNGKHYIGLTITSLEQRKGEHNSCAKRGDNKCLYNAIRKYNMVDSFELIEIDTADTVEELREKEISYIISYNSYYKDGYGYNMTYGGEGSNGYVFTEEDRLKMSESGKRYYQDNPDAKHQNSERRIKFYQDNPDAKHQVSETLKIYFKNNPDARQQISEANTTRFANPVARQKQSEAQIKRFENPEEIRKSREAQIKYNKDHPERGKEHSVIMRKKFEDNPERGKEHSIRIQKYNKENPEAWKKRSDKKGKNKQIDVFTKDGTFIKTFTYQLEAKEYLQKEYNITTNINICGVLNGRSTSSSGFIFKYK